MAKVEKKSRDSAALEPRKIVFAMKLINCLFCDFVDSVRFMLGESFFSFRRAQPACHEIMKKNCRQLRCFERKPEGEILDSVSFNGS
jgi:hypothetical protein